MSWWVQSLGRKAVTLPHASYMMQDLCADDAPQSNHFSALHQWMPIPRSASLSPSLVGSIHVWRMHHKAGGLSRCPLYFRAASWQCQAFKATDPGRHTYLHDSSSWLHLHHHLPLGVEAMTASLGGCLTPLSCLPRLQISLHYHIFIEPHGILFSAVTPTDILPYASP